MLLCCATACRRSEPFGMIASRITEGKESYHILRSQSGLTVVFNKDLPVEVVIKSDGQHSIILNQDKIDVETGKTYIVFRDLVSARILKDNLSDSQIQEEIRDRQWKQLSEKDLEH